MPKGIEYVLGKDCKLFIDDEEIPGVSDVTVREVTSDIDVSQYRQNVSATAVVVWGREITLAVPDIEAAKKLNNLRIAEITGPSILPPQNADPPQINTFYLPQIVPVRLEGGLKDFSGNYTIHEVEHDQPLDGAVIPRFVMRRWGAPVTGV